MNTSHAARRLRPFLAGSIVLHLALLASAAAMRLDWYGVPAISVRLDIEAPLVVAISGSYGAERPASTGAALAAIRNKHQDSRLEPLPQEPQRVPDPVETQSQETATMNDQDAGPATQAKADDTVADAATSSVEFRGRAETELARYFRYPPLARREGWEGVVQLQFDVAGDGAIENIRVASSSGFALLDHAAQEALAKAARLALPPAFAGGMRTIELPVHYRLTDAR